MAGDGVQEVEKEEARVCPRCGSVYRTIEVKRIGDKLYLYAYHGKKGKVPQLCSLGPVESPSKVISDIRIKLAALQVVLRDASIDERVAVASELGKLASEIYQLALNLAKPQRF
jgi:uncharacterized C2H2 Zn-finger protein